MKTLITFIALLALPLFAQEKAKPKPQHFDPVKKNIEGWTVWVEPVLLEGEHAEMGGKALSMLGNHLERIAILLPEKQLKEMKKLEIWIEYKHELVPMQYHPGKDWLIDRGYDPRLEKKVHITRAEALLSRHHMLKHPAVILHELAHSYHDNVLGFGDKEIFKAYHLAMKEKLYDEALLYTGEKVRHYGATNHKEYFAEATEAYFYHNDFYPFVRAELKLHDPRAYAQMERVWGKVD